LNISATQLPQQPPKGIEGREVVWGVHESLKVGSQQNKDIRSECPYSKALLVRPIGSVADQSIQLKERVKQAPSPKNRVQALILVHTSLYI
jgi:hypothetical protein